QTKSKLSTLKPRHILFSPAQRLVLTSAATFFFNLRHKTHTPALTSNFSIGTSNQFIQVWVPSSFPCLTLHIFGCNRTLILSSLYVDGPLFSSFSDISSSSVSSCPEFSDILMESVSPPESCSCSASLWLLPSPS